MKLGKNVKLSCIWGDHPDSKTVTWYRQLPGSSAESFWQYTWNYVIRGSRNTPLPKRGKWSRFEKVGSETDLSKHTLKLWHMEEGDMGTYWCAVQMQGKSIESRPIQLYENAGKKATTPS